MANCPGIRIYDQEIEDTVSEKCGGDPTRIDAGDVHAGIITSIVGSGLFWFLDVS